MILYLVRQWGTKFLPVSLDPKGRFYASPPFLAVARSLIWRSEELVCFFFAPLVGLATRSRLSFGLRLACDRRNFFQPNQSTFPSSLFSVFCFE